MAANHNNQISVNVQFDTPALTRAGFTTLLIAGLSMTADFTQRVRSYASVADITGDADLNANLRDMATVAFGQTLKPAIVKIGRLDTLVAGVDRITVAAAGDTGDVHSGTVLGQAWSYTVQAGDTATQVSAGIKGAIDALSLSANTTDNDGTVDVTATVAGESPATTAAGSNNASSTAAVVTPAVGVDDGLEAINAEDGDWYGLCLEQRTDVPIKQAAIWAELNDRLFIPQTDDDTTKTVGHTAQATHIGAVLRDQAADHVVGLWHSADDEYADVAWSADRLSVDPDQQATIWGFVQPVGDINANTITTTEKLNLTSHRMNVLLPFYSTKTFSPGRTMSGRPVDLVILGDWLGNRVKTAIADLLLSTVARGEKIPYTDVGFARFTAVCLDVFQIAANAGHIIGGTQFVNMPTLASIPAATREARVLNFTAGAEPSGAVEQAGVTLFISLDLTQIGLA
ncbi:MAG: DUF3383 family protein [Myxococcota bacterium]